METKICVFEENEITFQLSKDNGMMVNATEMAKIFGKEVARFMENDSTKKFIESCLKTRNSSFLNIKNEDDLYVSKQKSGTYMHRILALKFAAWLNPDFEVWVYTTIEKLLFGKHVEREKSLLKTNALRKEKEALMLKEEKTGADFDRYIKIEGLLNAEKSIRANLTKEAVHEMGDLFAEENEND